MQELDFNCKEHSGLKTRLDLGIALLGVLVSLSAFSSFVQVPAMQRAMEHQIALLDKRLLLVERDVTDLRAEDIKIKNQRNLDHASKDNLQ